MASCLQLRNLSKCYGDTVAVSGLSLDIEQGEVFGLLGPNGAGKSTTLYMLTGLVRPTSGTVTFLGKDIRKHYLDVARRMGVAVERPAFYDYLSVRKNLLLMAQLAGRDVTVDRILDMVGMLHAGSRKAGSLSHGMRQRLGLAQALLTEPEVLILDEPTAALDARAEFEVFQRFKELSKGKTAVLISHRFSSVRMADRILVLADGGVEAEGTHEQLMAQQGRYAELFELQAAGYR